MYLGLHAGSREVLSGMFARYQASETLLVGARSERVAAELVSGDYFDVLGVRPALGRTLGPDDNRVPGGHPQVVLGDGFWQRRFGGSAGVLDTDVRLNGHPMTIVGVAAPGFNGVDMSAAAPDENPFPVVGPQGRSAVADRRISTGSSGRTGPPCGRTQTVLVFRRRKAAPTRT
jgi:hypothetical protein